MIMVHERIQLSQFTCPVIHEKAKIRPMSVLISQNVIRDQHGIIAAGILFLHKGILIHIVISTIHLKILPGHKGFLLRADYSAFHYLLAGISYAVDSLLIRDAGQPLLRHLLIAYMQNP